MAHVLIITARYPASYQLLAGFSLRQYALELVRKGYRVGIAAPGILPLDSRTWIHSFRQLGRAHNWVDGPLPVYSVLGVDVFPFIPSFRRFLLKRYLGYLSTLYPRLHGMPDAVIWYRYGWPEELALQAPEGAPVFPVNNPEGMFHENSEPSPRQKAQPNDPGRILALPGFSRRELDLVLETFALYRQQQPAARLVIAAGKTAAGRLKKLSRSGVEISKPANPGELGALLWPAGKVVVPQTGQKEVLPYLKLSGKTVLSLKTGFSAQDLAGQWTGAAAGAHQKYWRFAAFHEICPGVR